MSLLYHAYVYLEFLILACTIYILAQYTSDFVITKADGNLMVRECVSRKHLTKPMTTKLLDASRNYWKSHGVSDWGIVIEEEV